jgi:putative oxidoreductase
MEVGLLVLRVVVGALLAGHGAQKLFGWFGGAGPDGTGGMFESLGLRPGRAMALAAGLAELTGGMLFALGLLTPLAGALLIAVMLCAIATVHWPNGVWNTQNGFEYPLVLAAVAFAVTAVGAGDLSLDHAFGLDVAGLDWALAAAAAGIVGGLGALALRSPRSREAGPTPAGA